MKSRSFLRGKKQTKLSRPKGKGKHSKQEKAVLIALDQGKRREKLGVEGEN